MPLGSHAATTGTTPKSFLNSSKSTSPEPSASAILSIFWIVSSSAVGLISEKDLTVGGEIAEGQFAVVVRATLWGQRVAVKQLKARDDAVRRAAVDASNPRRADETSRTRPTLLPHRETPSGPACRRRTGHRS